jgi:predicted dehydrogenase
VPVGEAWGQEKAEFHGLLHTEINQEVVRTTYPTLKGDYGDYYKNIYNSIKNGAPLKETAEDGYKVIKIIELAFESSRLKKQLAVSP